MKFFFSLCISLFFIGLFDASAQISENAQPYSSIYNLSPITHFEEMPYFSKSSMVNEDEERRANGIKVRRFAKMLPVGLHPFNSGIWDETGAGKVWRLGIHSSDAYSLYLVLNEFKLTAGVKMFVYNIDYSCVAGAFTSRNNNKFNKLSIAPISGEAIIVELDIPSEIDDFGKLMISQVGHDYRNEFGNLKRTSNQMGQSDTCEVDINCAYGDLWQTEKRAICKLIVNGEYCTGTLVNNAANLKIPYLITAYHCVQTESIAEGGVYILNYERVTCNGTSTTIEQSLSGAELIATTDYKLDFSLLKLNDYPPLLYKPYFVGWDARPDQPLSGVVIHHPNGDVKKISIDNHPLITGSFGEGFDSLAHWQVMKYDVGATEGGSSGSPIFNGQHRLFGTLTGGQANCSSPQNDFFAKLSVDWNKYLDSANQVKCWLDPENKSISFINGIDPYTADLGVCDTFWNVGKNEQITISKSGFNWGYLSGHNSAGYTAFAEKFLNQSTVKIPGVFFYIAKAYNSNLFSTINLKIWEGNSYPTTEIYHKPVYIKNLNPNKINFLGFDTLITVGGNFFVGYEINYTNAQDTFAVYHSVNRGGIGPSTMYVFSNGSWKGVDAASSPSIYSSLSIGLIGCDGSLIAPKSVPLKVSPNPFIDEAQVDLPEGVTIQSINTYDCTGRLVQLKYEINNGILYLYSNTLSDGVYVLEIKTLSKPLYTRFVLIRK